MNLLKRIICFFRGHDFNDWYTTEDSKFSMCHRNGTSHAIVIKLDKRECHRCEATEIKERKSKGVGSEES